jgi:hypothetical protein
MIILKVVWKAVKWVGVAVGVGGFASGFISPEVSAIIAGAAYVVADVIYFIGDYLDDNLVNKSFEPHK